MLTTVMAMNRLSQGDLDTARVDIKRTHEREAIIAEWGQADPGRGRKPRPRAPRCKRELKAIRSRP